MSKKYPGDLNTAIECIKKLNGLLLNARRDRNGLREKCCYLEDCIDKRDLALKASNHRILQELCPQLEALRQRIDLLEVSLNATTADRDSQKKRVGELQGALKEAARQATENTEEFCEERGRVEDVEGRLARTQNAICALLASGLIEKKSPR